MNMHKLIMQLIFALILTAVTKATELGTDLQDLLNASSLSQEKKELIMHTFNEGLICRRMNDNQALGKALQDVEDKSIKYEEPRS